MATLFLARKQGWSNPRGILLPAALWLLTGCGPAGVPSQPALTPPIPAQTDWVDYGSILQAGASGEWDYLLWGGFTATAVKKDGAYYLYYQGAFDYKGAPDDTVTWRAIGVATSQDGITFTKYRHNPIITWIPNKGVEEGAVSGSVTLDDKGEFVMFYGANTQDSDLTVTSDGRLATSTDGFSFVDLGVVLDHRDRSIWGSGNELFPIIALNAASGWYVYYLPNGTPQGGRLGVAWGDSRQALTRSAAASSAGAHIPVWGMGGQAQVGADRYALFLNDVSDRRTEVRLVSLNAPQRLSPPVETYHFDGVLQATILLDEETRTWFMYYRGENEYGVKLAPAGAADSSPPTTPGGVGATPISDRQIDLTWSPAMDPDTGVVVYEVYRDGVHQARVKGLSFSDTSLDEATEYSYEVAAVNFHGVEGSRSAPITATTLANVTPEVRD